jgi:phosphatidylglycerol---prolipoprotein diacylglyceryl transferase
MIALGFLASIPVAAQLAKKRDIDPDQFLNALIVSFMGGIVGARLYFVALNLPEFLQHPESILMTWLGGMSIHGGIIGGIIAGFVFTKIAKLPFLSSCDIIGTVLPLGQAIGRWGNFFNSEAFGRPVPDDFPLKLFIPFTSRPEQYANNEYFHPTFLYESVWDLGIFFLLYFVLFNKLNRYKGMTFLAYLALYSVGRMMVESLRVDSIMFGAIQAPYLVSIILIVASLLAMVGLFFHTRNNLAKAEPDQHKVPEEKRLDATDDEQKLENVENPADERITNDHPIDSAEPRA